MNIISETTTRWQGYVTESGPSDLTSNSIRQKVQSEPAIEPRQKVKCSSDDYNEKSIWLRPWRSLSMSPADIPPQADIKWHQKTARAGKRNEMNKTKESVKNKQKKTKNCSLVQLHPWEAQLALPPPPLHMCVCVCACVCECIVSNSN